MKSNLPRRNYPLLLVGQFLGAFGDNFVLAAILGPLTFQLLAGKITEQQVNAQNTLFSAVFFVPFILLAPLAGFLNDRLPKTTWLLGGNALKLAGTLVGLTGVWLHQGDFHASRVWQVIGYTIIGLGACVYSPAKYGVLPEILPADRLVKANGTVEMLTLIAILGGLWGGASLYDHGRSLPLCYGVTAALYAVALIVNGLMSATPCDRATQLGHSVGEFGRHLASLARHPRLGRVLLGCGLFWFTGAVLRTNLQGWGLDALRAAGVAEITNQRLALLKIGLIIGVVAGSLLAGQWHRTGDLSWARRYGLLLAGAVALLGWLGGHAGLAIAVAGLVAAGLAAGLLLIPLNAALQHESDPTRLGKTIAVQNFTDYWSMLLGAGFMQLLTHFGLLANPIFLGLAATVAVLAFFLRIPAAPAPGQEAASTSSGRS
ncbi:MFS transporter [Opitutus sp. ER46]|uniref:MFS transporter n=1 Tax=Opitutus sp. ER46 TaxID=2161864 RepID=UPI001E55D892|nr:MFS transporter [Opitutus sp. ER46]